jgi:hypothetical protein
MLNWPKDLERRTVARGTIPVIFLDRLAENHEKLVHGSRYLDRDSNRAHPNTSLERYR